MSKFLLKTQSLDFNCELLEGIILGISRKKSIHFMWGGNLTTNHHFYCEKNDHREFRLKPRKRMADYHDYQDPTRRERDEQERKEKDKKHRIRMIEAFVQTASITLNRYHSVKD